MLAHRKHYNPAAELRGILSIKTTEIYISLIADDTKRALEKLYAEPVSEEKPKKSRRQYYRRTKIQKLNITDNFDSLTDEEWMEISKRLAELMVAHISEKNFE
ncbi:hypothetical protein KAR91_88235 [Candidatus Pacearchaeota archaeon]|nr:hypothetical protein [Candidatus Pacearchaeota archaeon]